MASAISLLKRVDKMLDPSHAVLLEYSNEIESEGQALVSLVLPVMRRRPTQLGAFSRGDRFERMSGPIVRARLHFAGDERSPVPRDQIYLAERTAVIRDDDLITFRPEETGCRRLPAIAEERASLSKAVCNSTDDDIY